MAGAATDVAEEQIGNVREFLAKKKIKSPDSINGFSDSV